MSLSRTRRFGPRLNAPVFHRLVVTRRYVVFNPRSIAQPLEACRMFAAKRIEVDDMIDNMKTIAITIEEAMLERLDRLTRRQGANDTNRSRLIRRAVREYVARVEQQEADEREAAIVRRHRARLARQAAALVRQQAKP